MITLNSVDSPELLLSLVIASVTNGKSWQRIVFITSGHSDLSPYHNLLM
ncbi:hypothetical protein I5E72_10140 [Proteus terrae]|nr:hypothetical protein [Proteus terrae]MBG5950102.1 hypothetical protein [Proteus terrae]